MQRLDVRNELRKGTSACGSKTLSQAYLLPCCVWTVHCCESCCYLRNSSSNKDAAVTAASLFSSLFPFPIPFFSSHLSSLPFPQHLASTTLSFSLPFFCPLGILRMTSESPSLLKIHCQINIKAGGKIHLALCDLLWSATQDPGFMAYLPTSQGYKGLGDPQLLETPWWGEIPSSPSAWMRWVETHSQGRRGRMWKLKPLLVCFLPTFFSSRWTVTRTVQKMVRSHRNYQRGEERKKEKERKRKETKQRKRKKAEQTMTGKERGKSFHVSGFGSLRKDPSST